MKIPQEIAEKIEHYQKLKNETEKLYTELKDYFEEECDAEGFAEPFIADKPRGAKQTEEGEYCDQTILGEDWFRGDYFYKIENSDKYAGYTYEI